MGNQCGTPFWCTTTTSPVVPFTPPPTDEGVQVEHQANTVINQLLNEQKIEEKHVVKILVLGAGESGKSTILKQMKILHANAFKTQEERQSYVSIINRHIIEAIHALIIACLNMNIPFDSSENKLVTQDILKLTDDLKASPAHEDVQIPLRFGPIIKSLWVDTGIQHAYNRSHEFYLIDSTEYFLTNVERIVSENYDPTLQDILHARQSTNSIIETCFSVDQIIFKLYDVGGQRGERRKWTRCFDAITVLLFMASLSEYNQVLAEDRTRNRMKESLDLFEAMISLPWFRSIPVILFLNKVDLFEAKINQVDLGIYFPRYTEGYNYERALQFITDEYCSRNKNPQKTIYVHVTDATNTQNVEFVWKAAKQIILESTLNRSAVLV